MDQRGKMNQRSDWMGAREAAEFLGIKLPSLYAYASRGLVTSRAQPGGRARQYARGDLERLKARHDARAGHAAVAAGALRWGDPVLETSIGTITPAGPTYRGREAVALARAGVPFESVAELLWTGSLPAAPPRFAARSLGLRASRFTALVPPGSAPLGILALLVQALALADRDRFVNAPDRIVERARAIIARLASSVAFAYDARRLDRALAADSVAESLADALGVRKGAAGTKALDAALVLCADHELNVSTFAARVAASAGADVYACLLAALATLTGPKHGGLCDRVEALVEETAKPTRAADVIAARARRGDAVPGFGHPLYPHGDPRASMLFELARSIDANEPRTRTLIALADAGRAAGYGEPVLDLGLVALAYSLGCARGAASTIFAIGRTAGWVAHINEQYAADFLLRPRARYLGTGRNE
jgi:citrate synthase